MFGLGNTKKKKQTTEQLAQKLYHFAKEFAERGVEHELSKEDSLFQGVGKNVFERERLIMIFWVIDAFYADKERSLTAAIHKQYFEDKGILNKKNEAQERASLIMSRYKEYYDAYEPEDGLQQHALGSVIAKNIFEEDKPNLDARVVSDISADIPALVKQLKKSIFNKYELENN